MKAEIKKIQRLVNESGEVLLEAYHIYEDGRYEASYCGLWGLINMNTGKILKAPFTPYLSVNGYYVHKKGNKCCLIGLDSGYIINEPFNYTEIDFSLYQIIMYESLGQIDVKTGKVIREPFANWRCYYGDYIPEDDGNSCDRGKINTKTGEIIKKHKKIPITLDK